MLHPDSKIPPSGVVVSEDVVVDNVDVDVVVDNVDNVDNVVVVVDSVLVLVVGEGSASLPTEKSLRL
jgi:hypothetical protein